MKSCSLEQIEAVLPSLDLLPAIEAAFAAYSEGRAVVPPVGELLLAEGEVHIKYGYLEGDDLYVIKVASGFYGNPARGLPSTDGLMMLFEQATGRLACILLDRGRLTDVRTAAAGAIAAKHLAPSKIERIGIVGTGVQARLQLEWLKRVVECRDVLVWGRREAAVAEYCSDMASRGFDVAGTLDAADILRTCRLVVTTTPSTEPLLSAGDLQGGTHITAVGSDTPHKQELDAAILERADVVVADSVEQCLLRGEIHQAIDVGMPAVDTVVELGAVIAGRARGRTADSQVTVADLTGLAVQDVAIAEAVYRALEVPESQGGRHQSNSGSQPTNDE